MKSELKKLYTKDQKLAHEVAKVLGYRIKKVKSASDTAKEAAKLIKNTENALVGAKKFRSNLEGALYEMPYDNKLIKALLKYDTKLEAALSALRELDSLVQNVQKNANNVGKK